MIKFVCTSCGERLSVPDQHGGRKGVCPSCHAINRIPLKGSSGTKPKAGAAQPDGALATQQRQTRTDPPASEFPREAQASKTTAQRSPSKTGKKPVLSAPPESPAPEVNPFALDPAFDESPADYAPITKERRMPRKLKLTLLILGALGVAAALYFALYFALQTLIGKSE